MTTESTRPRPFSFSIGDELGQERANPRPRIACVMSLSLKALTPSLVTNCRCTRWRRGLVTGCSL